MNDAHDDEESRIARYLLSTEATLASLQRTDSKDLHPPREVDAIQTNYSEEVPTTDPDNLLFLFSCRTIRTHLLCRYSVWNRSNPGAPSVWLPSPTPYNKLPDDDCTTSTPLQQRLLYHFEANAPEPLNSRNPQFQKP